MKLVIGTLYKFNCKLIKYKIIEDTYNKCTKKYLKKLNNTTTNMYTYTTFVSNKLGIDSFNQQIKKHKTTKISIISDDFNNPILVVTIGSKNDYLIF